MPESVNRTCADLISNNGTGTRSSKTRIEQPCGMDASGYCMDCSQYVCSTHEVANHSLHRVARR